MIPTTAPTDFSALIGQAVAGLLLIPVIWYMLRDLRANTAAIRRDLDHGLKAMDDKLVALKLEVASDATKHEVRHLKEAHVKFEVAMVRFADHISELERKLAAIQSRLGDSSDN